MSQITLRNLDSRLERIIRERAELEKKSLNQVCTELLAQALGIKGNTDKKRDLSSLGGTWTEADYRTFKSSQAPFNHLDEELWN